MPRFCFQKAVTIPGRSNRGGDLFVAQVIGESMNKRIPNGAWCLWRANPGGSRQGKVVLARHQDIHDPELGQFTVKIYESEKAAAGPEGAEASDSGGWRHERVVLRPASTEPGFEPMVFEGGGEDGSQEGALSVVAELVEVLG